MTITAKNYAAQAIRGIEQYISILPKESLDISSLTWLKENIKKSVHFAIPDGGRLINDDLKGLRGIPARLPFPKITIEYYFSEKDHNLVDDNVTSTKRVIFAQEASVNTLREFGLSLEGFHDDEIIITVLAVFTVNIPGTSRYIWIPSPIVMLIPSSWDNGYTVVGGKQMYHCMRTVMCAEMMDKIIKIEGSTSNAMERLSHDMSDEVAALFEFLEALACSNVETTVLQEAAPAKVATKRAKAGKLPIYETKVLTIKTHRTTVANGKRMPLTGHRTSPRQHLRRGHVRELADKRRIWINQCVVGDISKGRIVKGYEVE